MAHLFDMIHPNFFSVLSSPNKKTYVDCIFIIYNSVDSIEESFQGDRENVVKRLINYFDNKASEEFVDIEEEEKASTSRQKANHVINVLKRCGWLGEEELGDYKTSINFFDYSIRIIAILDTLYAICDRVAVLADRRVITVAPLADIAELIRKLKTLKANIYRYYYDITKDRKKQDLQELLEKLLVEYKQNFFDSAYYNLKTKDSLPRYKSGILKGVAHIYDDEEVMDYLANKVMVEKRISNYNDAFHFLEDKLRFINDSFLHLENLTSEIDLKNEQYISATTAKILFLTNHSDDIEGIFNRLFKIILKDDDFDYNSIIHLTTARNLDYHSLYNQRRYRIDTNPAEIYFDDFFDDDMKNRRLSAILKHSAFSKSEINKYVLSLLEGRDEILASNLKIEGQEEYIKLILIFVFSKSIGMNYDVSLMNYEVRNNFVSFRDFNIFLKK